MSPSFDKKTILKWAFWSAVVGLIIWQTTRSRNRVYTEQSFFTCEFFGDLDGDGNADTRRIKTLFGTNESIYVVGYVLSTNDLTYAISNTDGKSIIRKTRQNKGFGLTHRFRPGQLAPSGYIVEWIDPKNQRLINRHTFTVFNPPTAPQK